jgi:hypothetical protein
VAFYKYYVFSRFFTYTKNQCCGSGSGIRCIFDPWIREGENQDPDPGSGSGMGMNNPKPDPESGMNIPDNISESLETIFWLKNTYIL